MLVICIDWHFIEFYCGRQWVSIAPCIDLVKTILYCHLISRALLKQIATDKLFKDGTVWAICRILGLRSELAGVINSTQLHHSSFGQ